jgi:hypothetical protein
VAAKLKIADLLCDGAQDSEELAEASGTPAPSLYRVPRVPGGVGVLKELDQRHFALGPLGALLQSDAPGSPQLRRPEGAMLPGSSQPALSTWVLDTSTLAPVTTLTFARCIPG